MGSWCSRRQPNPSASVDVDTISMSSMKTTPDLSSPQAPAQAISPSQAIFPPPLPPPRQSDSGHISLPPQAHHVKSSTTPPLPPPRQAAKYKSSELPATVAATAAVAAFRSQREGLLQLIRNCLSSLANALYAQFLIPEDARERATNESVGTSERSVALLDCVEARSKALPTDFIKIVQILESDPYLEAMASKLVHSCLAASQLTKSQLTNLSPLISAAISHYSSYLKALYKQSPISPVNKWPPTPSKEYVQLALVQERGRCRDEYIGHVLEGNVKQILRFRKECSIDQILDTTHTFKKFVNTGKKLILIEGAPGIGKSTFAWELCRKWEELECMQKFCLVVLLRLRERKVQKITEISDLFKSCGATDYKSVSNEVSQNHGSGVLFILDGFDELPQSLQHEGFIMDLIAKTVLPESTVVVTSRPSATAELLTSCRPLIWKHIEILGFTQESVEAYAATIFSDPSELERFKNYISASNNPAINSLMYVPINAAIIVQIFKECDSKSTLPFNLTQLYSQLCLTILNKHVKAEQYSCSIQTFEDLPCDMHKQFLQLSKIAFEGIKTQQVIFHNVNLSCHFGFLDSASSLYGGGKISFNFLHLTLQEFFAAYFISQFPHQGAEFYGRVGHWNVVWRFVAGLTKFEILKNPDFTHSFFELNGRLSQFFIQCLFEANTHIDFKTIFGTRTCKVDADTFHTPFDLFALGYCVANCSTKEMSWSIECGYSSEFIQGLRALASSCLEYGAVKRLRLRNSSLYEGLTEIKAEDFVMLMFECISLKAMVDLSIKNHNLYISSALLQLSELIPHLTSLQKLEIMAGCDSDDICDEGQHLVLLLQQLLSSSVNSLTICGTEIERFLKLNVNTSLETSLCNLFGTLHELIITSNSYFCLKDADALIKLASQLSSLKHLSISCCNLRTYNTHNNIKKLTIISEDFKDLQNDIVRIIDESKELRIMDLSFIYIYDKLYILKAIISALKRNSYLQTLQLSWKRSSGEDINNYDEDIKKLSRIDPRTLFEIS